LLVLFENAPSRIAAIPAREMRLKSPKPKLKACHASAPIMLADDLELLLRRALGEDGGGGIMKERKTGLCVRIRVFRLQTKLLFNVDSNFERYLSFGEVI
jgi:hypothetical protein